MKLATEKIWVRKTAVADLKVGDRIVLFSKVWDIDEVTKSSRVAHLYYTCVNGLQRDRTSLDLTATLYVVVPEIWATRDHPLQYTLKTGSLT